MRTYTIRRTADGVKLLRKGQGTEAEITPAASLELAKHSVTGFEFGYGGSGPAQLALAILLDHFSDGIDPRALALEHYQDFKCAFISKQEANEFTITQREIAHWHADRIGGRAL